ncbi:MAG: hypothetical protein LBE71_05320, partial [Dysgonamonadaceae bacterium]|nr:hypothetical protein [Dysgonamonadaceae bacterium]
LYAKRVYFYSKREEFGEKSLEIGENESFFRIASASPRNDGVVFPDRFASLRVTGAALRPHCFAVRNDVVRAMTGVGAIQIYLLLLQKNNDNN